MRVLILQPAPPGSWPGRSNYVDDVARLGARLRERGHEPSLLLMNRYDEDALRLKISDVRPEQIVVYLESYYVDLVRRLTEHLANRYYLPIVIGGPHATVAPHETLSLIGVEGVVLCEWDRAVPDYLEARQLGPDYVNTRGFWFHSDGGIIRNPLADPEKPEEMVVRPDRSLYTAQQVVDNFGRATVEPTRGCQFYCAHCQMDLSAGLYEQQQLTFMRRRPMAALISEVEELRSTYPAARSLRMGGCNFPLDEAYLREFGAAFSGPLRMPFSARAKTSQFTPAAANLLRQAGCYEIELEVLSGSDFIRNEIFSLDLAESQIVVAFAAARQAGLKTRALVQVGLPYETIVTIEQTGRLLRRVEPDTAEVTIYYPLPGTKAYDVCHENGWLSGRTASQYFLGESPLDLPGLSIETIRRYAALIPHLVHHPQSGPLLLRLERIRLGRRTLADLVAPLLGQKWAKK